jgi:hypothetical protein
MWGIGCALEFQQRAASREKLQSCDQSPNRVHIQKKIVLFSLGPPTNFL